MQATQHDATGFNLEFGKTWIYPTNLPIRKYQKDIVGEALFKNTMVCLPTGLGKTFIAAVVMYNFYRWYPSGKIIFMATTKPLVKQQVDACYGIVAIPKESTAELTGSVLKQNRTSIWKDKRVFFLTPQVLRNDLDTIDGLGSKIKCIVIDEAHRARGNHAYCEVINKLQELNKEFRVLALTATPASNVVDVISICQQLLISHLEVRTENSADVQPYSHQKSIQTIVLKLDGKLSEVINDYKKILDKYVRILVENKVIHSNFSSLHKGRLFYLSKEYQEKNTHNRSTEKYKLITKVFATCTILYHAYDLLLRHGLRSFVRFFEESINKPLLTSCSSEIQQLVDDITNYVGPPLICDKLPDGSHLKLPENCKFGHPKFYKLREILSQHFATHDVKSKVIIFCEYKDSVAEAYAALLDQPSVKPKMFMGQSSITQKQQVNIIDSFRSGNFNTLISTCIGEEGINVGFVDIVICFDISNKSSVRFIQRIGRTGRDRNGRVVILVSEGREQQVLKDCLQEKQHLSNALIHSQNIDDKLYKDNPKMIPDGLSPECQELFIAPKKVMKLTNYFTSTAASSTMLETRMHDSIMKTTKSELRNISNFIPKTKFFILNDDESEVDNDCLVFNKHLNLQRTTCSVNVPSSSKTDIFIDMMRHIDYSRFNIKSKKLDTPQPSKKSTRIAAKKQTDIRNMFKQCSQISAAVPDEKELGIETLLEAKITSILANREDCGLCGKFESDLNIKRDLVPIGYLNLKIDLNFDATSICNLQYQISEKLNKNKEKECQSQENIYNEPVTITNLPEESPIKIHELEESHDNKIVNASHESPDLFDEELPVFSPPKISNGVSASTAQIHVVDEDIIEASPSPLINKRKASQTQSIGSMRAKKRIKFDCTDIFDASSIVKPPTKIIPQNLLDIKPNNSKSSPKIKVQANDLFDFDVIPKPAISETRRKKFIAIDLLDMSILKQKTPTIMNEQNESAKTAKKKKITANDLFNVLPTSQLSENEGSSSPNLSSFIPPADPPVLPKLNKSKKQLSCFDILDTSLLKKASPKINLSVLKSPTLFTPSNKLNSEKSNEDLPQLASAGSSTSLSSIEMVKGVKTLKSKMTAKRARQFIDSEAEVSSDEMHSADEHVSSQDGYDSSFVDDDDAKIAPATQTQAMYLQSVRSPFTRAKPLIRPAVRHVDDTIFQETVDLTYAKDSFCIDDDSVELEVESLDELEKAELELKNRRKNKITAKQDVGKRKRIRRIESDSD